MRVPRCHKLRKLLKNCSRAALGLLILFSAYVICNGIRYGVPLTVSVRGTIRDVSLLTIRAVVEIHDPVTPRRAVTGPFSPSPSGYGDYASVETVFPPGQTVALADGTQVTVLTVRNEVIIRSPHPFGYQPYDDPRLQELRTKYRLDDIVAPAADELTAQVLLRSWTRSQFKRADYQPKMDNFDALEVLDRGYRNHGEPYSEEKHFDPCHFFPIFMCQVMVAAGHQARMLTLGGTSGHGVTEVWSNQYGKWVYFDAELNQHIEKDGVPLSGVELLEENYADQPTRAKLVRGTQTSDENTTMAHMKVPEVPVEALITWFNNPLELADLRNDWMTNHYFRGHPARSEWNSLTYVDPRVAHKDPYGRRLRRVTSDPNEFNWTLNQVRILCKPCDGRMVDLVFDTVTPNFKCFECVIDGAPPVEVTAATFRWQLHDGTNTFRVRPVNQFGIPGRVSVVELVVTSP